jgi:hypothetical protein
VNFYEKIHLNKSLQLFTGKDCCLCEQAQQLVQQCAPAWHSQLQSVDIKSSPDLYHLYAARIPVLKRLDNQTELGWPFDAQQLTEFLY